MRIIFRLVALIFSGKASFFKSMKSTMEEKKIISGGLENNLHQQTLSTTSSSQAQPQPPPPIQSKIPVRSPPPETKFSPDSTADSRNPLNSPQSPTKTYGA